MAPINIMRFAAPGVPARMWTVSGTGCNDAPVDHACSQQCPCFPPELQKFSLAQAVSGAKRVQARTKQKFRTIDISDPADDRLVHQQSSDGSTTCQNAIDGCFDLGIFPQWIRPNPRDQFFPLCPRQDFASRWSAKLEPVLPGREAEAERASSLGERQLARSELAVQAKVNVQLPAGSEIVEQVLPVSFNRSELPSVQQRRPVFEPAIRRFHCDDATSKQFCVLSGMAVKFVSFWHSVVTCWMFLSASGSDNYG